MPVFTIELHLDEGLNATQWNVVVLQERGGETVSIKVKECWQGWAPAVVLADALEWIEYHYGSPGRLPFPHRPGDGSW